MTEFVRRPIVVLMLVALASAAWPMAMADAAPLDANATIETAENGVPLWDAAEGSHVRHVLVTVEDDTVAPIVLVTVASLGGLELATAQPAPPAPWVASWSRDTIQFLGTTAPTGAASFVVRVLSDDASGEEFQVDLQSAVPALGRTLTLPALPAPASGAHVCQVVVETLVEEQASYAPFGTLSDVVATQARAYVAVFDARYGEYLDPSMVVGEVRAMALDGEDAVPVVGADMRSFPFGVGALPVRASAAAPVLDPSSSTKMPVAMAALWDETGAERTWFAQRPGSFRIAADATVEGSGCTSQPYVLSHAVTPLAPPVGLFVPTPLVLVPPEADSDADGYVNLNELRGNSNPLLVASTPYTDDDEDEVINVRDALPFAKLS